MDKATNTTGAKLIQRLYSGGERIATFGNGHVYGSPFYNPKSLKQYTLDIDTTVSQTVKYIDELLEKYKTTFANLKNSCLVVRANNKTLTFTISLI